jgi:hypothetical protein
LLPIAFPEPVPEPVAWNPHRLFKLLVPGSMVRQDRVIFCKSDGYGLRAWTVFRSRVWARLKPGPSKTGRHRHFGPAMDETGVGDLGFGFPTVSTEKSRKDGARKFCSPYRPATKTCRWGPR